MRRAPHDGQKPRRLHENATSSSRPHGDDEGDQDRDVGEVELAPGSEVMRELAVR